MESKGCLICSSTGTHSFEKTRIVERAMKKILKYLLIPKEDSQELLGISLNFCQPCFSMVNEVVEIAKKIEALEILIQGKSQEIGNKVMRSPVSNKRGPVGMNPKNFVILWERFKKPVIQNYMNKKLPDPSVRMVHADQKIFNIKREPQPQPHEKIETPASRIQDVKVIAGPSQKTPTKSVSQRVIVKKGIKKEVPIKMTHIKERIALNNNIRKMTKQIATGVRIGPKCYLKRIGRGGPTHKGTQQPKANEVVFTGDASKNKTNQKIRVGPKSYLKKIGRFNETEEQLKSGHEVTPIPGTSLNKRKIEIRSLSLTSSSSSQQPEKAQSSYESEGSEELFQEVRLTKSQLDAMESNESSGSENSESAASTDPFEEYVPDRFAIRKSKQIKRWLDSIETPAASDEEEELLDIVLIAVVLAENCTQDKSTGIVACKHCSDFTLIDSPPLTKNKLSEVLVHVAEQHYALTELTMDETDVSSANTPDSNVRTEVSVSSTSRSEKDLYFAPIRTSKYQGKSKSDRTISVTERENILKCPACGDCITPKSKTVNAKNCDLKRVLYGHYFKSHTSVYPKPAFSLRHQKMGYLCDECDFFSEVIYYHVATTKNYDSQRAWSARRTLVKHHMEFHLTQTDNTRVVDNSSYDLGYIANENPFQCESMNDEDSESDGSVLAALLEPEVILSYPSQDEMTVVNLAEETGEKGSTEDDNELIYETDDQVMCPKCAFTVSKRNLDRQSAQNKLLIHYRKDHLPEDSNERLKNADGQDYYRCILCDFKAVVEYSASTVGVAGPQCRYETRLKLAWHYISKHDPKKEAGLPVTALPSDVQEPTVEALQTPKIEHEDQSLSVVPNSGRGFRSAVPTRSPSIDSEGTDEIFKCPICDFLSPSDVCVAESVKIRVYRARQKIYSHYALSHLEETVLSNSENGIEGYQCISCDYFARLGTYKSGYHAKYFAKSTLAKHILEEHDDQNIDPVKSDLKSETFEETLHIKLSDVDPASCKPNETNERSEVEVIEIDCSSDEEKEEWHANETDFIMDCDDNYCDVPVIENVFSQSQLP